MSESNAGTSAAMNTEDREIVITRVFDAPRELVWKAWTDPQHVVQWWGPKGFTTTIHMMEVKPGGVWRHTMHGPDGTDYPNKCVFIEVVKHERIVYTHGGSKKGDPGAQFEATWTFKAQGNKTKLTLRMVFPSASARQHVIKTYGAIEGGKQTLERLSEHLAKMDSSVSAPAEREIVLTRIFDAPRALVFKAWTDPKLMVQWWGPRGFTNPVCELDVRVGGAWRIVMRTPDGMEYPCDGVSRGRETRKARFHQHCAGQGQQSRHRRPHHRYLRRARRQDDTYSAHARYRRRRLRRRLPPWDGDGLDAKSRTLGGTCGKALAADFVQEFGRAFPAQRWRAAARNCSLSFCICRTSAGFSVSSCAAAHSTISVSTGARSIPLAVSE
jgi:uncharacterized protein YndB with AHSA1/START domain